MKLLTMFPVFFAMTILSFAADMPQQKPQSSEESISSAGKLELNRQNVRKPFSASMGRDIASHNATDVCYTLRTYRMVREDQDSDVTRPDGYSTCQSASQFQVRRAVGRKLESH
ncbi:MAG: hypothetical protein ACRD2U_02490 [Terriglobales bacterium]